MKEGFEQKKGKRGKKTKISFDEEVINKDQAEKLLSEQELLAEKPNKEIFKINGETKSKQKEKQKKRKLSEKDFQHVNKQLNPKKKVSLGKEPVDSNRDMVEPLVESVAPQEQEILNQPKKESRRAQKRKKHAKLLEEKKLNADLELQKKTLNYLSKWKHSRSEWKFEKLKQVWIQQNLFDATKIPSEFWETTLEYFSGAKGHSRQVVLDEALKIIETEDESSEENLSEDYQTKLKRARDIVQHLQ